MKQMDTPHLGFNSPYNLSQLERRVEDRPLGLNLNKSKSFCDFVSTMLSQTNKTVPNVKPLSEKLKASNLSAIFLKIGSWERFSVREGDLIVKFYFAKKKIVWEILDNGLKSKIEIPWSDIEFMRGFIDEHDYGTLEIMLSNPPQFHRESTPQPRKHTIWHTASDFTCGQATIYRKHYVQFPRGTFDQHYEKLLQYDPHLFEISQRSFPTNDQLSPFFKWYDPSNISFSNQPLFTPSMNYNQSMMIPNFAYIRNIDSSTIVCEKARHNVMDMPMMSEPTQLDEIMYTEENFENGTYKIIHECVDAPHIDSQPLCLKTLDNMHAMSMDQFASYEQPAIWELAEAGSSFYYRTFESTI